MALLKKPKISTTGYMSSVRDEHIGKQQEKDPKSSRNKNLKNA